MIPADETTSHITIRSIALLRKDILFSCEALMPGSVCFLFVCFFLHLHLCFRLHTDHRVQMMNHSAGLFLCDAVLIQSSGLFSQSRCFM